MGETTLALIWHHPEACHCESEGAVTLLGTTERPSGKKAGLQVGDLTHGVKIKVEYWTAVGPVAWWLKCQVINQA